MERRTINPWTWQNGLGFVHAHETVGGERTVHCAGQTSVDAHGRPLHSGDIVAQTGQALDNLETVLREAGMSERVFERANQHYGAEGSLVHRPPTSDVVLHNGMVHQ